MTRNQRISALVPRTAKGRRRWRRVNHRLDGRVLRSFERMATAFYKVIDGSQTAAEAMQRLAAASSEVILSPIHKPMELTFAITFDPEEPGVKTLLGEQVKLPADSILEIDPQPPLQRE